MVTQANPTTGSVTVDEYEVFIQLPENQDRSFELIDGEIVEKVPTYIHSKLQMWIGHLLIVIFLQNPIAEVLSEIRIKLSDEFNDRQPDVAVVLTEGRTFEDDDPLPIMPELVIEIRSPSQSHKFLQRKADYYLQMGARMVWLVYPRLRIVEVITPDDSLLLGVEDTLDGGDVLPDLSLPVRRLFERMK